VLVPLDGSDVALEVLGVVRRLARLAGTAGIELALLHVVEPPAARVYAQPLRQFVFDEQRELAAARRYLGGIAETGGTTAREVTVHVAIGTPAAEIAALARTWGADLVAMATHGRGGLSRLVMGSTAAETLRRAETPLLLVLPAGVRVPSWDAAIPARRQSTAAAAAPLGPALAGPASPAPA
jgi:nucleotide-binding universal stress UspA family protein